MLGEARLTALEDTISANKKPGKKPLRNAVTALRETPMMIVSNEKHNGFASTITFACSECGYKSTFNTSPSFRPYKFSGVMDTVPLKAADADDGIPYDGDAEDNVVCSGGNEPQIDQDSLDEDCSNKDTTTGYL